MGAGYDADGVTHITDVCEAAEKLAAEKLAAESGGEIDRDGGIWAIQQEEGLTGWWLPEYCDQMEEEDLDMNAADA